MIRKKSETPSPHFEEYLYTYILDTKGKKNHETQRYICIPFPDRGYITLTIPLRTVYVPTEVLEVDVTPFSWQRKVYYFFSFSFSLTSLFSLWRAEVHRKNKITCLLSFFVFHISDRVSRSFPLFSRRLLSVVCTFFDSLFVPM